MLANLRWPWRKQPWDTNSTILEIVIRQAQISATMNLVASEVTVARSIGYDTSISSDIH